MPPDPPFLNRAWVPGPNATSVSEREDWDAMIGEIMVGMQAFPEAREALIRILSRKKENQPCPTCGIVS
jgi:hypothetical protein